MLSRFLIWTLIWCSCGCLSWKVVSSPRVVVRILLALLAGPGRARDPRAAWKLVNCSDSAIAWFRMWVSCTCDAMCVSTWSNLAVMNVRLLALWLNALRSFMSCLFVDVMMWCWLTFYVSLYSLLLVWVLNVCRSADPGARVTLLIACRLSPRRRLAADGFIF